MEFLKNKKILFIAPIFYDYHKIIKLELESFGAKVYYFPEREHSYKFTVISNFFPSRLNKLQEKHYADILAKTKDIAFDYLFIIKGYKLPENFLIEFRKLHHDAKTMMYQWDSEINNKYVHLIKRFDKVFSFDRNDVSNFPDLRYLPLFYTEDIKKWRQLNEQNKETNDILYFGFYQKRRYEVMKEAMSFAKENNIKLKTFLYVPLSNYIKERFLKNNKIDLKFISFKPLKRNEYLKLLFDSKVVFDTSSINQTGLSMRVIETIGAGKKLITYNKYIKDEDVYNPDEHLIFDGNSYEDILSFINKPSSPNYGNYFLTDWLRAIFSN